MLLGKDGVYASTISIAALVSGWSSTRRGGIRAIGYRVAAGLPRPSPRYVHYLVFNGNNTWDMAGISKITEASIIPAIGNRQLLGFIEGFQV